MPKGICERIPGCLVRSKQPSSWARALRYAFYSTYGNGSQSRRHRLDDVANHSDLVAECSFLTAQTNVYGGLEVTESGGPQLVDVVSCGYLDFFMISDYLLLQLGMFMNQKKALKDREQFGLTSICPSDSSGRRMAASYCKSSLRSKGGPSGTSYNPEDIDRQESRAATSIGE